MRHESGEILYGSLYECILDRSLIPGYDVTSPLLILASVSTITESDDTINITQPCGQGRPSFLT